MLKCDELMRNDFLKATEQKIYRLNHYDELKRIVAFSFIKNLNNILKEENTIISYVKHDFVILYTVWGKREATKIKIVDFAVSIDIDEESEKYKVTDCLVTTWENNIAD